MNWQALRDLVGEGYAPRTLLDVGAHVGEFSKSFVALFPGCTPTLLEPNPHCAPALSALPFESHAVAASDRNGEAELHLTQEWLQSTGASLYRENTHFFRDEVLVTAKVPMRRIDDLFPGRKFDVVKIDTQGAELDVLRGGCAVIAQADFVLIEISLVDYNKGGAQAEDVFAALTQLGFDCAGVLEFHRLKGIAAGGLLQMDFLFKRRSLAASRPVPDARARA
jgi:FkbM family methyltransferase